MKQITSAQHPTVKHLVKLRDNRSYRYEKKAVLIEGPKMIREICQTTEATILLTSDSSLIPKKIKAKETLLVPENIIKKISGARAPEGIIAEVPMPQPFPLEGLTRVIALDGISDPGNMGTLLRTALALGWQGAYILEGSCDPYNDKALRSAKGATFRLPLCFGSWNQLKQLIQKNSWTSYLADMDGESIENISPDQPLVVVFGNEAHGASPEAKQFCTPIAIPMGGEMESLNVSVAGGIIMYILRSK